jgi:hypothetical protein
LGQREGPDGARPPPAVRKVVPELWGGRRVSPAGRPVTAMSAGQARIQVVPRMERFALNLMR